MPIFAQASPITIKWLLLNRLRARQFLVNIKLPDHPGTGKRGTCALNPSFLVAYAESIVSRTDRSKLPVPLNRKLRPG